MKRRNGVLGGLLLLGTLGTHAMAQECEAPGPQPDVPDGAAVEESVLAEAGNDVREFVAETQDYLACLEAREASLGEDITEDERADLINAYNSAVETMQAVADDFNEQVRRYREELDD